MDADLVRGRLHRKELEKLLCRRDSSAMANDGGVQRDTEADLLHVAVDA